MGSEENVPKAVDARVDIWAGDFTVHARFMCLPIMQASHEPVHIQTRRRKLREFSAGPNETSSVERIAIRFKWTRLAMVYLKPTDDNDISPLRGSIAPFSTATIAQLSIKGEDWSDSLVGGVLASTRPSVTRRPHFEDPSGWLVHTSLGFRR